MKSVRDKIAELTQGAKSVCDFDRIVSKAGGLEALWKQIGGDRDEFAYEWDMVKNSIKKMTRYD
jgi:hypothetical protein